MRATLFLLIFYSILGLFLWTILSGALLVFGAILYLFLLIISMIYTDTLILYLLGAREVRSSDQSDFFEAASQESYKLSIRMPRLYFYNGTLERAFILQNRSNISIVISKQLLENCSASELAAVCFELLLQVKKGMASKRTKSMFILGLFTWFIHSVASLLLVFVPSKNVKQATGWLLNYILHPCLDFLFKLILGESYFRKLENSLKEFPREFELLKRAGLKFRKPLSYYSLPSRKLMELSSTYKSRHYQRILALEFLPHEWDYLFTHEELTRVE